MGCHAPGEDVDDDEGEFLAAAHEDPALVANLLLRLSRSETCVPWRQLRESTPTTPPVSPPMGREGLVVFLPELPKWRKPRARSRSITRDGILAAKREDDRRASPTTPLSWSGGSTATSGSVCGEGPSLRRRRRKQRSLQEDGKAPQPTNSEPVQTAAICHDAEPVLSPPAKWMKVETAYQDGEPHRVFVAGGPPAVASSSGSASSKADAWLATFGGEPNARRVEPLRLRLTGDGTNPVVVRRPGKKKTLPELKALEESLLQEQVELHKALEEQKKIYGALLDRNTGLKNLASHTDSEPPVTPAPAVREEAKSEEPHRHTQSWSHQTEQQLPITEADHPEQLQWTSPSTSAQRCALLFDLNLPPDLDL